VDEQLVAGRSAPGLEDVGRKADTTGFLEHGFGRRRPGRGAVGGRWEVVSRNYGSMPFRFRKERDGLIASR
jgi:hypothetical protein